MDTPDTEIKLFGYEDRSMAEHDRFQEWRKANWHGGFMLILSGAEGRPLMHKAACTQHFGDADHRIRNNGTPRVTVATAGPNPSSAKMLRPAPRRIAHHSLRRTRSPTSQRSCRTTASCPPDPV
jgi:hypothetical protein